MSLIRRKFLKYMASAPILAPFVGPTTLLHPKLEPPGVAKNVLQVTLTDKELWITAPFPFLWIAYYYDGVHRIPIHAVKEATKNHKRVFVKFQRKDGGPGQFELRLKRPDEFLGLLNKLNAS